MAAQEITPTEVTAARRHHDRCETRLYTATTQAASDWIDLSAVFELVYYVKAWKVSDGTDAEVFVANADYAADDITFTQNAAALYVEVTGTSLKSIGGAT